MIIGGVDQKETSKLKRKAEKEAANLKRMKKNKTDESKSQTDSAESSESEGDTDSSENVPVECRRVRHSGQD